MDNDVIVLFLFGSTPINSTSIHLYVHVPLAPVHAIQYSSLVLIIILFSFWCQKCHHLNSVRSLYNYVKGGVVVDYIMIRGVSMMPGLVQH